MCKVGFPLIVNSGTLNVYVCRITLGLLSFNVVELFRFEDCFYRSRRIFKHKVNDVSKLI